MKLDELIARECIRDTLARHNYSGDRDDAEGYAATFTEDAILESPLFRSEGREAILAWKRGHRIFAGTSYRLHHVSSILIEVRSQDSADVVSNWLATTNIGPDHCGRYVDRFTREGERWLIAHRRIDILWQASDSVLGGSQPRK